ncbi:MAG: tRNA adenosine(34) deaminase TadA [Deltaproteobacteria bacterium]|nr:tRNA adenosine(34) deaminase TadA [Deltaproteobacteria bacterium]MCL5879513.1 tRNA adenosine(34) deaminase TadA [Deltaproteobacteria bacterium]MDA8305108.1 tRNA adenosine(34) deaminase TadA [Deltaproteobacteria bacterium]
MNYHNDIKFMELALGEAKKAKEEGEVPVGAIITIDNRLIASSFNTVEKDKSSIMHAEIKVILEAQKKLSNWRLEGCSLYVTLEPCLMCCGAIVLSRIKRLVYGAKDLKTGAADSLYSTLNDKRLNHNVEVIPGVMELESSLLLKGFFKEKRRING